MTFNQAVHTPTLSFAEWRASRPRYVSTPMQPGGRDIPPEDMPSIWRAIEYERARQLAGAMPQSMALNDRLRAARQLCGLDTLGV